VFPPVAKGRPSGHNLCGTAREEKRREGKGRKGETNGADNLGTPLEDVVIDELGLHPGLGSLVDLLEFLCGGAAARKAGRALCEQIATAVKEEEEEKRDEDGRETPSSKEEGQEEQEGEKGYARFGDGGPWLQRGGGTRGEDDGERRFLSFDQRRQNKKKMWRKTSSFPFSCFLFLHTNSLPHTTDLNLYILFSFP